jgi:hypothetical protein
MLHLNRDFHFNNKHTEHFASFLICFKMSAQTTQTNYVAIVAIIVLSGVLVQQLSTLRAEPPSDAGKKHLPRAPSAPTPPPTLPPLAAMIPEVAEEVEELVAEGVSKVDILKGAQIYDFLRTASFPSVKRLGIQSRACSN